MTIGILGGGQLGYMLALAGYPLGLHFRFLDPSPQAPVGRIAHRVTAAYSDHDSLEKFAHGLELVTYEFENVPVEAARFLAKHVPVYPPPEALEAAQDRLNEKSLFKKLGIATTSFAEVNGAVDVDAAFKKIGLPARCCWKVLWRFKGSCRFWRRGAGRARPRSIHWWRIIIAEEFCG